MNARIENQDGKECQWLVRKVRTATSLQTPAGQGPEVYFSARQPDEKSLPIMEPQRSWQRTRKVPLFPRPANPRPAVGHRRKLGHDISPVAMILVALQIAQPVQLAVTVACRRAKNSVCPENDYGLLAHNINPQSSKGRNSLCHKYSNTLPLKSSASGVSNSHSRQRTYSSLGLARTASRDTANCEQQLTPTCRGTSTPGISSSNACF